MEEYCIPTAPSRTEYIEKHSKFIGWIFPCETEADALDYLEQTRKRHWDATHNVYAYIIHNGPTRFSDDGEPGGTAGMPVLEVLKREGLENVLCVVTRYFGGTLLGAGGLVRAYAHSASISVAEAGISVKKVLSVLRLNCPYGMLERVKSEVSACDGFCSMEYGADVITEISLPESQKNTFLRHLTDLSSGTLCPEDVGNIYRAIPRKKPTP